MDVGSRAIAVTAFFFASLVPVTALASADTAAVWHPPAPLKQEPLWPAGVKIAQPEVTGPESVDKGTVRNVTVPTMTIYPAKGTPNGTTIVVFPGGGFEVLAIDVEGSEICDWLTSKGITCALLKYRVPVTGPQWDGSCHCRREPKEHMATEDAQRAIALLRHQASALKIDPHRIGVMGFSAGGHMVAEVSTVKGILYHPVDDADKESVRPDFAVAGYPGHIWEGKGLEINPTLHVTSSTPPTFIVQAEDDNVDNVRQSLTYYMALLKANVPVEMHLYTHGKHAFALRHPDWPVGDWPNLAEKWMHSIGML